MSVLIPLHAVSGTERLTAFRLCAEAAFAYSATNFYAYTLRRRGLKPNGTYMTESGEQVGSSYSLATRSFAAAVPVTIYENDRGLVMADGERLYLEIATTGSPAVVTGLSWELDIQAVTR